eukprot:1161298-Pelagomonas_calceolata.AAC.14
MGPSRQGGHRKHTVWACCIQGVGWGQAAGVKNKVEDTDDEYMAGWGQAAQREGGCRKRRGRLLEGRKVAIKE